MPRPLRIWGAVIAVASLLPSAGFGQEKTVPPPWAQAHSFVAHPVLHLKSPFSQAEDQAKNPGQAFLRSLLLPGLGEFYAQAPGRARTFMIAEGLLWATFATLKIYGHWKQGDLEDFAVARAGVNSTGKTKTFYTDVSNFRDIHEHNEEMRRFRRYDDVYPLDADNFWQWQSDSDQQQFDDLRLSSARANRNATLVIGAILANHVISAIDAIYVTRRHSREIASNITIDPETDEQGDIRLSMRLSLSW